MRMTVPVIITAAAVWFDLRTGRIPNRLILSGMIFGSLFRTGTGGWTGLLQSLSGMGLPILLLGILYYFRMMGAGDIKLLSMAGSFLGPEAGLDLILYSFLWGGVISALLILKRHNLISRLVYFKTFIIQYLTTKQWKPYRDQTAPDSLMHFSLPVLLGLVSLLIRNGGL